MTSPALNIQGIDVFIEGDGQHTVVMVHGWPDTHRLWDNTVEALQGQYRCVRFTLPGFDVTQPARATSLAQMTALFCNIVDAASPGQPVTLLLHDWGCIFGYEFTARHPERVARIVAVDIGDHNAAAFLKSLTVKAKWQVLAYQLWLAVAWKLGGTIRGAWGNRMTRGMARAMHCRTEPATIGWQMNYPYAMQWLGLLGGFRGAAPVNPTCPLLYIYGERKPFMFHSPQWLAQLATQPGCAVQAFSTGHWVMVDQPAPFNNCVGAWLATAPKTEICPHYFDK